MVSSKGGMMSIMPPFFSYSFVVFFFSIQDKIYYCHDSENARRSNGIANA